MEVLCSSEMLVTLGVFISIWQTTRYHIWEDCLFNLILY